MEGQPIHFKVYLCEVTLGYYVKLETFIYHATAS